MRDLLRETLEGGQTSSKKLACALKNPQTCQKCQGSGVMMKALRAFAEAELCQCLMHCQSCQGRAREIKDGTSISCREPSPVKVKNILNGAKIPAKYAAASFQTFDNFTGNGRQVADEFAKWSRAFHPKKTQGLLIGGPVGVGKTYLLACMTKELAKRGVSVRFVDFFHLLSILKSAYTSDKSEAEIMQPLIDVDVLIIDELGKGRNSDWELTVIDSLVSNRYDANKTIIAATNYKIDLESRVQNIYNIDLEKESNRSSFDANQFEWLEPRIGKRTYSRLLEMCQIVSVEGKDYRRVLARRHGQSAAPTRPKAPEPRS